MGLATAYQLSQNFPDKKVVILEKENSLAKHQTGHNSGVLHSGIYYKPGSLKAINCRMGKQAMEAFCEEQEIEHELCGKVIVALNEEEIPRMEKIYQRGQENGVNCEIIPRERLLEIEPHAAGVQAIHVPECGIVNYKQVCLRLGEIIQEKNGQLLLGGGVKKIESSIDEIVVDSNEIFEMASEFLKFSMPEQINKLEQESIKISINNSKWVKTIYKSSNSSI